MTYPTIAKVWRLVVSLLLACILGLVACVPPTQPARERASVSQTERVSTNTSAPQVIATVAATKTTTYLPLQSPETATSRPKDLSPTNTFIQPQPTNTLLSTLTPPKNIVRDGYNLPSDLDIIGPGNIHQLTEIARWGKGRVYGLAYSPNGSQVAVATGQGVYYYETHQYEMARFVPIENLNWSLIFSNNLTYLAQAGDGVEIWDLNTGQLFRRFDTGEEEILTLAFTPDESQIYVVGVSQDEQRVAKTYVWDIQKNKLTQVREHGGKVLTFSADGRTFAALEQTQLTLWHDDLNKPWRVITADDYFTNFALSPDGKLLALVTGQGTWESFVQVWKVDSSELWQEFHLKTPDIYGLAVPARTQIKVAAMPPKSPTFLSGPGRFSISGLAFSPDSQILSACNGFGYQSHWRLHDGALLRTDTVNGGKLIYSPSGDTVVSVRSTVEFRQASSGELIFVLGNHAGSANDLEFAPDDRSLAMASSDGMVWWRSVQNGAIIRTLVTSEKNPPDPYFSNSISSLDYARDGSQIVAATYDGMVYLWPTNGGEKRTLKPSCVASLSIRNISLSPDNQYLAFGAHDSVIEIRQLNGMTRHCLGTFTEMQIAFSPVAPLLAVDADSETNIALYRLPELDVQKIPDTGKNSFEAPPVFSNDGQILAVGSNNSVIGVWNVENGNLAAHFDPGEPPKRMEISPGNRLLAVLTYNHLMVYEVNTRTLLYQANLSGDSMAFSHDGRLLAIGDADGLIHLLGVLP